MLSDLSSYLQSVGRSKKTNSVEIAFPDYVNLVATEPQVAQLAVQRLYNMILSHGTTIQNDGSTEFNFFTNKMFGAQQQIQELMTFLEAASMGLDIKKRVALLLGPPGGGKSQILSMLKKGLEDYSRTKDGAVYAIKECPINEDPLHLIPEEYRAEFKRKFGITIEGKLCPVCQKKFRDEWSSNLNNVAVSRVYISESNRVGIGTFAPAEKNSMDELVGSENLRTVEYFGNAGDERAYVFNGELHRANRGIMEFIEVLKAKTDFLHILLTLAEEQQFKVPRFPLQYVDEALIAHTNEGEFLRFLSNRENEAIIDRLYIIRCPYIMDEIEEAKIYHNALKTKLRIQNVKFHPGSLRVASHFAVFTRQHDDVLRQGMQGISPRFILNTIALVGVRLRKKMIEPIDMLNMLKYQIYNYPVLDLETREKYLNYLDVTMKQNINFFNSITEYPLSDTPNNKYPI
ncbi:hypothetical protein bcgnr5378_29410 [Bacillus cereus]|uniref:Serine protein kinase (PrkA protein) P-loop containing n=1 Tax=Bacillus cereus TaxID=1396 RepID=A0A161R7D4_BACCE|nr:hypothetical protein [Bacillus cereus]KZD72171.1 Serine protein kinase (prkA protein) P-loop containing [Bacillus cereus]HDR8321397.1 hypothetical protein [Bacillus cereus]HDR8331572.1 hypothetical protein [Bacillus cereus]HDR8332918.1 hypothetical protein [Bacillus cereus]